MEKSVIDIIFRIIIIVMGLLFAVYHRQIGQWASDFYYKLLHIRFNVKGYQITFLIVGIAFMTFGIIDLLKLVSK